MRKTSDILWQDLQHQVLFDILDAVREPGAGPEVLARLQDYIESHFALEEQYMALFDYPDREAHIRAHDRFRHEIGELLTTSQPPDDMFLKVVGTFLTEWLTRHVFGIDKELEEFLKEAGQR